MKITHQFNTDEELKELIKNNMNLFIVEISYLINGSFIIFTDEKNIEIELKETQDKVSILTQENKQLKQEQADLLFTLMENNVL